MPSEDSDPAVIDSIAVTVADVVAAVETNETSANEAVLRLTPPFSGRMRARLHVVQDEPYDGEPEPIHVPPEQLLTDDAPAYPRPSETEDELRRDPENTYTVERHHDRHSAAVDEWRAQIAPAIVEQTSLETNGGSQTVTVSTLGDLSKIS